MTSLLFQFKVLRVYFWSHLPIVHSSCNALLCVCDVTPALAHFPSQCSILFSQFLQLSSHVEFLLFIVRSQETTDILFWDTSWTP